MKHFCWYPSLFFWRDFFCSCRFVGLFGLLIFLCGSGPCCPARSSSCLDFVQIVFFKRRFLGWMARLLLVFFFIILDYLADVALKKKRVSYFTEDKKCGVWCAWSAYVFLFLSLYIKQKEEGRKKKKKIKIIRRRYASWENSRTAKEWIKENNIK